MWISAGANTTVNEFGASTECFYWKRFQSDSLEWAVDAHERDQFCHRRQEVKGRPGKQWLNESVVDNGLSVVSITREQENEQYQRESWVKEKATIIETPIAQWRQIRKSGGIVQCVALRMNIPEFKSQFIYMLNVLFWEFSVSKSPFPRL